MRKTKHLSFEARVRENRARLLQDEAEMERLEKMFEKKHMLPEHNVAPFV